MKRTQKDSDKSKSGNPDPITKAPGSHPVGTGVGAAAGGYGGKAVAEKVDPTRSDLERYVDYTVVDRDNNKVGTVDAVWEDHTGQPAYLGVKTGWLGMGRTHVIPAQLVDVSETTRKIRLPYRSDVVKNAPWFEQQSDIDEPGERRIADYYRTYGFKSDQAPWTSRDISDTETTTERARREERDDIRVPVSEEHVKVGKREVEGGGVRLRKVIRTETVNQPVELQREEIVVERVPAKDRPPTRTDMAFREEEFYIPLRREEPTVEKYTETKEEVHVSKKRDVEHRDIKETVRREDVEVQRTDPKANIRDDRTPPR